mmetsp:Transcript_41075/g.114160  ORF Transcript_41075/g.114160 Transcript_41075/m.114160 type:complete len:222 (-) Transcript_41075:100-765(-)
MAVNPVLAQDGVSGELFPLPQSEESFVLKRDGIDFECKLARGGKLWGRGCFFLSSKRLVFVASERSARADFKSFEIPLATLRSPSFQQPIFGANYLEGGAVPAENAAPEAAAILGTAPAPFSLTFNCGGCGTFLPLFFKLMAEVQERQQQAAASGVVQAAQEGRLNQVAYVDPSDPSVLYLSQPTAAPNSQQHTTFQADGPGSASGVVEGRREEPSNCNCS